MTEDPREDGGSIDAGLAATLALAMALDDAGVLKLVVFVEKLDKAADLLESKGDANGAEKLRSMIRGTASAVLLSRGQAGTA